MNVEVSYLHRLCIAAAYTCLALRNYVHHGHIFVLCFLIKKSAHNLNTKAGASNPVKCLVPVTVNDDKKRISKKRHDKWFDDIVEISVGYTFMIIDSINHAVWNLVCPWQWLYKHSGINTEFTKLGIYMHIDNYIYLHKLYIWINSTGLMARYMHASCINQLYEQGEKLHEVVETGER